MNRSYPVKARLYSRAAIIALLIAPASAVAQDTQDMPPSLDDFSLQPGQNQVQPVPPPVVVPTVPQNQVTPAPAPVRTPTPTPAPAPSRPTPTPTPAPAAAPAAEPPAEPVPEPAAEVPTLPANDVAPALPPISEPVPQTLPAEPPPAIESNTIEPATGGGRAWFALVALGVLLLAAAGGFLLWRRRRAAIEQHYDDADRMVVFEEAPRETAVPEPDPAADVVPPQSQPADPVALAEREAAPLDQAAADEAVTVADVAMAEPAAEEIAAATIPAQPQDGRPWIEFALRPVKAGVNVMDAVVEFELTVGNAGAVAADDVRIAAWLVSASPNQDAEIARFLENTPAEAIMAPIAIPPGDGQQVNAAIALPRAGVNVVTVRDRPFFVPLVVADARYRLPDGGEGRTSATFVVGTVRDGQEKLGPIWLDRGIRMHANVEARLHGDPARA